MSDAAGLVASPARSSGAVSERVRHDTSNRTTLPSSKTASVQIASATWNATWSMFSSGA